MRRLVASACMLGAAYCTHKLDGPETLVGLFIMAAAMLALAAADGGHYG